MALTLLSRGNFFLETGSLCHVGARSSHFHIKDAPSTRMKGTRVSNPIWGYLSVQRQFCVIISLSVSQHTPIPKHHVWTWKGRKSQGQEQDQV